MRPPDDRFLLEGMLDQARLAIRAASDQVRADLESDFILRAALQRFLDVLGEAASKTAEATRATLPSVPWREIVSMRNRLVHGYSTIDDDIVWEVVKTDLPRIVSALENSLAD